MMRNLMIVCVLLSMLSGCSEGDSSKGDDAALEAIDSSVIMNDSTALPNDPTRTTVTH